MKIRLGTNCSFIFIILLSNLWEIIYIDHHTPLEECKTVVMYHLSLLCLYDKKLHIWELCSSWSPKHKRTPEIDDFDHQPKWVAIHHHFSPHIFTLYYMRLKDLFSAFHFKLIQCLIISTTRTSRKLKKAQFFIQFWSRSTLFISSLVLF